MVNLKIIEMFIPKSFTNTRPGIIMKPTGITIHETDNTAVRANALAHAKLQQNGNPRQASWHYQVDDEDIIYQSLPNNEVAWAAGDGRGDGNMKTIHIEICVNRDGNFQKAVTNATKLVTHLLKLYPYMNKNKNVYQHNNWSGKNCPTNLRSGSKGITWSQFIGMIGGSDIVSKPSTPPAYVTTTDDLRVGQVHRIKGSATHYATGERMAAGVAGNKYTIMQISANRVLMKEIMSWVKTSDLDTPTPSKTHELPAGMAEVTADELWLRESPSPSGKQIRLLKKGERYKVYQNVAGWLDLGANQWASSHYMKWGGKTQSDLTKTFKVGDSVRIKTTATHYATGQKMADFVKGGTFTVSRVEKERLLLKEIVSWVNKNDVE